MGQWKITSSTTSACVQNKLQLEHDLTASTDHGEGRGVHGNNIDTVFTQYRELHLVNLMAMHNDIVYTEVVFSTCESLFCIIIAD